MNPISHVAEIVRIPIGMIQGIWQKKYQPHMISKQDNHECATARGAKIRLKVFDSLKLAELRSVMFFKPTPPPFLEGISELWMPLKIRVSLPERGSDTGVGPPPPVKMIDFAYSLKAFTLMELMTVIAITGILASLLLPVISKSKNSARRIQCTSNLRQLGLAAQLYWDDFEQKPFAYSTERTSKGIRYWFGRLGKGVEGQRKLDHTQGVLWPYIKGRGIERCPSFDYSSPHYKPKAEVASYGYGYNLHIANKSESGNQSQGRFRMTHLKIPSGTALLADAAQINDFQPPASSSNPMVEEFYYINFNPGDYPNVHFRHNDQANTLFCDGHVSSEPPLQDSMDPRLLTIKIGRLPKEKLLLP